jgi:hypothetical protein
MTTRDDLSSSDDGWVRAELDAVAAHAPTPRPDLVAFVTGRALRRRRRQRAAAVAGSSLAGVAVVALLVAGPGLGGRTPVGHPQGSSSGADATASQTPATASPTATSASPTADAASTPMSGAPTATASAHPTRHGGTPTGSSRPRASASSTSWTGPHLTATSTVTSCGASCWHVEIRTSASDGQGIVVGLGADWGDGTSSSDPAVLAGGYELSLCGLGATYTFTHDYTTPGDYQVVLQTASDDCFGHDTMTRSKTVTVHAGTSG